MKRGHGEAAASSTGGRFVIVDNEKTLECLGCTYPILVQARTTTSRDCPELLQVVEPETAWIGFVQDDASGPLLVGVCSEDCAAIFFVHGEAAASSTGGGS